MEPIHIFYKELSADKNNIFIANLVEKNEVDKVKFKKTREYVVTGLSINEDLDSKVIALTDTDKLETISNLIQKLAKKKKGIWILELEMKIL